MKVPIMSVTVPTVLEQKLFGTQITREPWTAETVRQGLPNVQVRYSGILPKANGTKEIVSTPQVITCGVCGRLNQFATVFVHGYALRWEFSWEAIAHSLKTGKPLQA